MNRHIADGAVQPQLRQGQGQEDFLLSIASKAAGGQLAGAGHDSTVVQCDDGAVRLRAPALLLATQSRPAVLALQSSIRHCAGAEGRETQFPASPRRPLALRTSAISAECAFADGASSAREADEPSTAPAQQQLASDDDVLYQTLAPLKDKTARLRAHIAGLQAQLVTAQQGRDRPDRSAGADNPSGAAALLAQAEQAEAFWKLKNQEAADAEAEWKSLRLEADSVSKVERLQFAMDKAERESLQLPMRIS